MSKGTVFADLHTYRESQLPLVSPGKSVDADRHGDGVSCGPLGRGKGWGKIAASHGMVAGPCGDARAGRDGAGKGAGKVMPSRGKVVLALSVPQCFLKLPEGTGWARSRRLTA